MHIVFVVSPFEVGFPRIALQLTPKPGESNIDAGLAAVWKIAVVIASSLKVDLLSPWATDIEILHVIRLIEMPNKSHFSLLLPTTWSYFDRKEEHVKG